MGVLFAERYTNHNESELLDVQLTFAVSDDKLFRVIFEGEAHDKHELTYTKSMAISPVNDDPFV